MRHDGGKCVTPKMPKIVVLFLACDRAEGIVFFRHKCSKVAETLDLLIGVRILPPSSAPVVGFQRVWFLRKPRGSHHAPRYGHFHRITLLPALYFLVPHFQR